MISFIYSFKNYYCFHRTGDLPRVKNLDDSVKPADLINSYNFLHLIIQKLCTVFARDLLFSPGIEPGTFRVLGGCDNHYTTKTRCKLDKLNKI